MSGRSSVPRRRLWDVVLSSALMLLAVILVLVGLFYDALSIFFGDTCPPATCSVQEASAVEVGAAITAVVVVAVGVAGTVALLVLSRRGWWAALSTVALVGITWAIGVVLFQAAIDHPAGVS